MRRHSTRPGSDAMFFLFLVLLFVAGYFTRGSGASSCYQCLEGVRCENGNATSRAGYWMVPLEIPTTSETLNSSSSMNSLGYHHAGTSFNAIVPQPVRTTIPCPYSNCIDGSRCNTGRVNPSAINPLCGQWLVTKPQIAGASPSRRLTYDLRHSHSLPLASFLTVFSFFTVCQVIPVPTINVLNVLKRMLVSSLYWSYWP